MLQVIVESMSGRAIRHRSARGFAWARVGFGCLATLARLDLIILLLSSSALLPSRSFASLPPIPNLDLYSFGTTLIIMEAELENYQFQLSQVSIALEADPTNAELTALKVELEEIIALTKEALGVAQDAKSQASTSAAARTVTSNQPSKGKAKESAASNSKNFRAGDEVIARYKDGKW